MNSSPFDSDVDFVVAKHGGTKLAAWQKFSYGLLIVMVILCTLAIVIQQRQLTVQERALAVKIDDDAGQKSTIAQLRSDLSDAKTELETLKKHCGKTTTHKTASMK